MKHIKVCPKCGSVNVIIPKRGVDMLNMEMLCQDCGNIGVFPEMKLEQAKKYSEKIKSAASKESQE